MTGKAPGVTNRRVAPGWAVLNRSTQRVRIGLTGLGFVFLLVLLAAVFTRASDEEPITANRIEEVASEGDAAAVNAVEEPNEPLAELGVAPGNAPANEAAAPSDSTVPVEDPLRPRTRR